MASLDTRESLARKQLKGKALRDELTAVAAARQLLYVRNGRSTLRLAFSGWMRQYRSASGERKLAALRRTLSQTVDKQASTRRLLATDLLIEDAHRVAQQMLEEHAVSAREATSLLLQ